MCRIHHSLFLNSIGYLKRKTEITLDSAASLGNRIQTSPGHKEAAISHEEWEKQGRENAVEKNPNRFDHFYTLSSITFGLV